MQRRYVSIATTISPPWLCRVTKLSYPLAPKYCKSPSTYVQRLNSFSMSRFKEEGIRRQAAYLRGSYRDMKSFGLIEPDLREA